MLVSCSACDNGIGSDGNPCIICAGAGEIDLLDDGFPKIITRRKLHGILWDSLFKSVAGMEDKIDDIMDKCNDIFEKVNE